MIEIDALGKDGHSILHDLQGASPGGGFVTSAAWSPRQVNTGDLVSSMATWCAVIGVRRNGLTGVTHVALVDHAGIASGLLLTAFDSVTVRTDARIDPDSLWKLQAGMACSPEPAVA
jgi:hypothetical protein